VKKYIAARKDSLNVHDIMKTAEEKFSSVNKEKWATR
jgi:hypothetical protein